MRSQTSVALAASALALSFACAHGDVYRWVDELPPAASDPGYHIGPGDTLGIQVFNQPGMSTHGKVRADGKISVPFLNDVVAAGRTPADLAKELENRFKNFIVSPVVTVTVDEVRQLSVSVLGEVTRPSIYTLEPGAGVLQALASAGGMTEYAHRDRIFVIRPSYDPPRIRFTYEALIHTEGRAAGFKLQNGDTVVVE